jgi:hypothetical protein
MTDIRASICKIDTKKQLCFDFLDASMPGASPRTIDRCLSAQTTAQVHYAQFIVNYWLCGQRRD